MKLNLIDWFLKFKIQKKIDDKRKDTIIKILKSSRILKNILYEQTIKTNKKIEEELVSFPNQKLMIKSYINFQKYIKQNSLLELEHIEKGSLRTFSIPSQIIRQYKIKKSEIIKNDGSKCINYNLKKIDFYSVNMDYSFWRIVLLFIRFKATFTNSIAFCYDNCWDNSFGIKALYSK